MVSRTLQRGVASVATLLAVSVIVFVAVRLVPGDPVSKLVFEAGAAGGRLTEADVARLRAEYGLDDPLPVQYLAWMARAIGGDLSRSVLTGESVMALVVRRLGATLLLAAAAAVAALSVGVLWGAAASYTRGFLGASLRAAPLALLAIPPFSAGIALAFIFAVWLRVLPSSGIQSPVYGGSPEDIIRHLILPAVTLALGPAAITARITHGSIDEQQQEDFVRTARAVGIPAARITLRHVLPNALLPVITNAGLMVAYMLTAAAFVEEVFNWPGIGKMVVDAVLNRDYPVLQAGIVFVAATYIVLSWLVDVLYGIVDPRITLRGRPAE